MFSLLLFFFRLYLLYYERSHIGFFPYIVVYTIQDFLSTAVRVFILSKFLVFWKKKLAEDFEW